MNEHSSQQAAPNMGAASPRLQDVVARGKAVLEGVTPEPWDVRDGFVYPLSIRCSLGGIRKQDGEFIAAARSLMPELIAEVERLRPFSRCPRCSSMRTRAEDHWEEPIIVCDNCGYGT